MKKIELIENREENTISINELHNMITDPKKVVIAKSKDGRFFCIVKYGYYHLMKSNGCSEVYYEDLTQLVKIYDVFIIGDPAKL